MKMSAMISRYSIWMIVTCLMIPTLCAQSIIDQGGVVLQVVPQVVPSNDPPDPSPDVKRCVMVQVGTPPMATWIIVPGWGGDENEAYTIAELNASKCSHSAPVRIPGPCMYAELPTCALTAKTMDMGIMTMPSRWTNGNCRVKGKLVYCDGTIPIEITTAAPTCCEAIGEARTFLCGFKDPCKRAYLTYCIESQ